MGPFVDVDHPRVRTGDLTVTDESGGVVALTTFDMWNLLGASKKVFAPAMV